MACESYRNSLRDAALGALDPGADARLRVHLAECHACRAEFARAEAFARAMDSAVAEAFSAEPSPEMLARLRSRIAQEPSPARWFSAPAWLPVAVGALALAALTLWIRPRTPSVAPVHFVPSVAVVSPERTPLPPAPASNRVTNRAPSPALDLRASAQPHRASPPELVVIVPPGEWRNVVQFVRAVDRHRQYAAQLSKSLDQARLPLVTEELEIADLEILPLNSSANDGAER